MNICCHRLQKWIIKAAHDYMEWNKRNQLSVPLKRNERNERRIPQVRNSPSRCSPDCESSIPQHLSTNSFCNETQLFGSVGSSVVRQKLIFFYVFYLVCILCAYELLDVRKAWWSRARQQSRPFRDVYGVSIQSVWLHNSCGWCDFWSAHILQRFLPFQLCKKLLK